MDEGKPSPYSSSPGPFPLPPTQVRLAQHSPDPPLPQSSGARCPSAFPQGHGLLVAFLWGQWLLLSFHFN